MTGIVIVTGMRISTGMHGGGFIRRCSTGRTLVLLSVLWSVLCWLGSVHPACELSYVDGGRMYNYSLTAPIPTFPHGVLSEDGFYKVTGNDTVLWFQLCNEMIFNHDPPKCIDCLKLWGDFPVVLHIWFCYSTSDCGGTSRCGMECNALVAEDVEGYPVCFAIVHSTTSYINITDKMNPHMGVTVQMSSSIQKYCSLSVSIVCDWNGVQRPTLLRKLGDCEYATELRHPLGCAKIVYLHGGGWGWFGVFLILILCVLGSYVFAGAAYRYFVLHVQGIDAIPNLEFWTSLPHRAQSVYTHIVRKIQGPSHAERSTYNPVSFRAEKNVGNTYVRAPSS